MDIDNKHMYRAYIKDTGEIKNVASIDYLRDTIGVIDRDEDKRLINKTYPFDSVELMRCTGIVAKASYRVVYEFQRLVFEGDVCEFDHCKSRYTGKMLYNPNTCALEMRCDVTVGPYGEKATYKRFLCHLDNIRIIGTIYDKEV